MSTTRFCTTCGAPAGAARFCTGCGTAPDPDAFADTDPMAVPDGPTEFEPQQAAVGTATATRTQPLAAPPLETVSRAVRASATTRWPWKAIGASSVVVVLVIAAAVVVLIGAGGKAAAPPRQLGAQRAQLTDGLLASRQLYASTQQRSYSALLPAGWHQVPTADQNLTGAVTVQSPIDDGATLAVGEIAKPARTLKAEASALRKSVAARARVTQVTSASYQLPGSRSAWTVAFTAGGRSVAYYLVSSCSNMFAVSASVPSTRVALLRSRVQVVAGTLQGDC